MLTYESFAQILLSETKAQSYCLALSGGLDSSVLLNLLFHLRIHHPTVVVRAIHINHGLSTHAKAWEKTCQELCQQYDIPLEIHQINLMKNAQESLEELARNERYRIFKHSLQDGEVLLTAHHVDDQAETLLLQLFRGCGPKGLASMPTQKIFGKGSLCRPLLSFLKQDLREYALLQQLTWVEDDSNKNSTFDRNFLRQEILPLIQSRWPSVINNIARTALHCANAERLLDGQLEEIFNNVYDVDSNCLKISALLQYDPEIQSRLIRCWLQKLNLAIPNTKKLKVICREILLCSVDATPYLQWKNVEVRRYGDHLYAMQQLQEHNPTMIVKWDLKEDLYLPNNLGSISLNYLTNLGLKLGELNEVTIRFRQGGERCRLADRDHSHSLKKLFQAWRVPPWQRERVPLLYENESLRAIIGYAVCQ